MKRCGHCDLAFQPKRADARFHSAKCRVAHFRAIRARSVTEPLQEPAEALPPTETDRGKPAPFSIWWYLAEAEKRRGE